MKSFKYVLLALLIAGNIQMAQSISKKIQPRQKLSYVESIISEMYVDKVDEDKLVEDAIRGMLEELDPHSTYSTREETLETQEVMQGSFSGIGIQFNMQKDTLYVIQTIAGGPSEKSGDSAGRPLHRRRRHCHCREKDEKHGYHENASRQKRDKSGCHSSETRHGRTAPIPHHARRHTREQHRCRLHGRRQDRLHPAFPLRNDHIYRI